MKLAIAILNWNGKKLLQRFLPSVINNSPENGLKSIMPQGFDKFSTPKIYMDE